MFIFTKHSIYHLIHSYNVQILLKCKQKTSSPSPTTAFSQFVVDHSCFLRTLFRVSIAESSNFGRDELHKFPQQQNLGDDVRRTLGTQASARFGAGQRCLLQPACCTATTNEFRVWKISRYHKSLWISTTALVQNWRVLYGFLDSYFFGRKAVDAADVANSRESWTQIWARNLDWSTKSCQSMWLPSRGRVIVLLAAVWDFECFSLFLWWIVHFCMLVCTDLDRVIGICRLEVIFSCGLRFEGQDERRSKW